MKTELRRKLNTYIGIGNAALVMNQGAVIGSVEYISWLKANHGGLMYLSPWVKVGGMFYQRDKSEMVLE